MKKNLLAIVLGTAAVVTAISCSNKDNFEPAASERVPMQFSAGTPAITKTAIAEDGTSVVWSEGDAIGIFDTQINKFDLIAGDGTSQGRFSGFALPGAEYYALYPYDEAASISGSTISATLPSAQYSTADGTFSTMLNPAVAEADASNGLAFEHVAAMLKVNVEGVTGDVKSITVSADKSLTGAYTVDMSADTWSAKAAASETAAGVTLTGQDGGNLAAGPYYLVVLPGEYANLTLTAALADGTTATGTLASLSIAARDIMEVTVNADEIVSGEFGFEPSDDLQFGYKGAKKTYTVNAPAGTAWTLEADSDDVTLGATNGTGTQTVDVTLPYSKYIYEKSYTLTLSADGQESKTLTITQQSCVDPDQSDPVGLVSTDGTLTANGASAMVKTIEKFKYGTLVWKFSGINLTSGCVNIQAYSDNTVEPATASDQAPYMMIRYGANISNMSAGGRMNIPNSWNSPIIAAFGFDNGWSDSSDENITIQLKELPSSVSDMVELKIVLTPSTRTGVDGNGVSANILLRQIYINGTLVLDNVASGTDKSMPVDIWQGNSTHPGFQWSFGLSDVNTDDPANGTMTIESFEYIPYE